jgi:hypothetical protein
MPFTFSHPAMVLPLTYLPGRLYSLTGLVIGSIAPDFEYFIRMKVESNYSHTIGGLFWFDLPVGFLIAIVYHNLIRNCFINNLPVSVKQRLSIYKRFNWNKDVKDRWFIIAASLLTGAASHVFWDSFTHSTGYFVQAIPALTNHVEIGGRQVPVFKIAQHASTLTGGLIVAIAIRKLPLYKDNSHHASIAYWPLIFCSTILIVFIRLLNGFNYKLYGSLIVTIISAGFISLIATSLVMRKRCRK